MSISDQMRTAWAEYECDPGKMVQIDFGPDRVRVAPETVEAWSALEKIFQVHGYEIRVEDTDSYNCRGIKSSGEKSLHSYGIALDVNWTSNPYLDHSGRRGPRFSDKDTQIDRAEDVRLGKSDTDMTETMIEAVRALKTKDGVQVFGWGGDWNTVKDAMHFQIQATPQELAAGIDWSDLVENELTESANLDAPGTTQIPPNKIEPPAFEPPEAVSTYSIGDDPMDLPAIFFNTVRKPLFFGSLSQTAVDNMTVIVNFWLEHYQSNPLNQLAYILATVRAEVGKNMHPVREGFTKSDAAARRHVKHRKYGKPAGPFGHVYYGRGYVQLTWHSNYVEQSAKLGVDFEEFPDLALDPEHAIEILVNGMMDGDFNKLGHGLPFYVNETKQDFKGARRTVNIQDRATEIAGFADVFLTALEKSDLSASDLQSSTWSFRPFSEYRDRRSRRRGRGDFETHASAVENMHNAHEREARSKGVGIDLGPLIAGLQSSDTRALLASLGMDQATQTKLDKTLDLLEKAGVVRAGNGLTPVNRALGDTLGKLLDGRKTALGVILFIVSIVAPQYSAIISLLSGGIEAAANAGAGSGSASGNTGSPVANLTSSLLMPLSALLGTWGALGKIDKWMHKPKLNTLVQALSKIR